MFNRSWKKAFSSNVHDAKNKKLDDKADQINNNNVTNNNSDSVPIFTISNNDIRPWMDSNKSEDPNEVSKDPGALTTHPSYTDKDFEGHRAHAMYVGFHVPGGYRRRQQHKRHKHHHRNGNKKSDGTLSADHSETRPVTPPAERVHFILGEEDQDGAHESHPLFSELEELCGNGNDQEWRETARWIKFEEDVEEGGDRWSKPHVATISLHSLFELRSCILNGTVMLDLEASSLDQIADLVLENMANAGQLKMELKDAVKEALLRRHRHQHQRRHDHKSENKGRLPIIRSLADIGRNSSKSMFGSHGNNHEGIPHSPSASSLHVHPNQNNQHSGASLSDGSSAADLQHKANQAFMKKIPPGSEADNILVGEIEFLDRAISGFVRLTHACHLGDLTEVPVPTRFIFILLGPHTIPGRYHEVGRVMATLMSDEVFHEIAYKAKNRQDLLAGVDEFLDAVTILPPGAWDPSIRIEPPSQLPSQESRKKGEGQQEQKHEPTEEDEEKEREQSGLKRTGRIFGGLINDVKRKAPWYKSDFTDALALQSIASIFFLYFACLAPIITFGGLLGDATGQNIATMESLLSGCICGIVYGLLGGQPLTILGSTGPVLVFETIVYDFCESHELYYLSVRLWIGLWTASILMVLVALDASALVCYITRFTEENFATLISVIFIFKALEKVIEIKHDSPMHTRISHVDFTCFCNRTILDEDGQTTKLFPLQTTERNESLLKDCLAFGGQLQGKGCQVDYVPDVFLFSIFLFLATFLITVALKEFKTTSFFPSKVRAVFCDFSVVIAIASMTALDLIIGLKTPKLVVPSNFEPTLPTRGWVIPLFNGNPMWTALITLLPALLATILIFMDQQITAVIINRKENKLKKGCGYHLDLFVLSILIAICSVLGLPWFVAATVLSMTHVNSLRMESECAAPGEKPQFLGVREQRLTQVVIFTMCGLSVCVTSVLQHIPMPILYGVFLYMGTSSLIGSQFYHRILIFFMPQKYQPDYMFLRHVPTHRVHLFTLIQLICFVTLWCIKSFKQTSIAFPLMLVVMIGVRKLLELNFTKHELKILDDVMPESTKRKKAELSSDLVADGPGGGGSGGQLIQNASSGNVAIPLANGNILKIPVDKFNSDHDQCAINISEQLAKSGAWKNVDQSQKANSQNSKSGKKKSRGNKKDAKTEEEQKRLSTMNEADEKDGNDDEEDDDCGITIRIDCPTPIPSNHPSTVNSPHTDDQASGRHNETSV